MRLLFLALLVRTTDFNALNFRKSIHQYRIRQRHQVGDTCTQELRFFEILAQFLGALLQVTQERMFVGRNRKIIAHEFDLLRLRNRFSWRDSICFSNC